MGAHLLSKRGKKDFAIKIKYSSAAAKGHLPYGPHGPAIIGYKEDPYLHGYGGYEYGNPGYGSHGYGTPGYEGYGYGNPGNEGYGDGNPGYESYGYGNSGYGYGSPYDSGYPGYGNGYDSYNGIPYGSSGYGYQDGLENPSYGLQIPNYGFDNVSPTHGHGGNINYGVPEGSSYGGNVQYPQQVYQNIAGYSQPTENTPYQSSAGYASPEVVAANHPYSNEIPLTNYVNNQVHSTVHGASSYFDPAYTVSNGPGYQPPLVAADPVYEPSVVPTQGYSTTLPNSVLGPVPLSYAGGSGAGYNQPYPSAGLDLSNEGGAIINQPHPSVGFVPINYESAATLNQQYPYSIQY